MDINQLEPLKELATIGAGNGATAISKMLDQEVLFEPPEIDLLKVEDVEENISQQDEVVTGVLSQLTGGLTGVVLLIFNPQNAQQIENMLTENPELKISALNEMVNIFLGSALKAVVTFLGMSISHSVTSQATDMLGALIDPVISKLGEKSEEVLIIKVKLKTRDVIFKALFLTDPESTVKVLSKLNQVKKSNGSN
jgi:chemotaxis protein CheC